MPTIWNRVVMGIVMAAIAGGAAVAVSPPNPRELQAPAPTGKIPLADASAPRCCETTCADSCAACPGKTLRPTIGVALEWSGPPQVKVNQPAEYTLTAHNISGRPVQRVTVQVKIPCCVDVTAVMPPAKVVDHVYVWDIGTLDAGETVPLTITMASPRRGELGCEAWVTCTGTTGMTVAVTEPRLEVVVSAPKRVVIGSRYKVQYTIRNTGDAPAETVNCSALGPNPDAMVTSELIEKLPAGASRVIEAEYRATSAGERTHSLTAASRDGVQASATQRTVVEGIPALRMQVVDLADPVEKGGETIYEIRVLNTGTAPDHNILVSCPLPGQLRLLTANGPTAATVEDLSSVTLVRFEPIRELAPKTEAVFRVRVKAITAGDIRFAAQMTSEHLTTSVTKEESTRVYGE